MATSEFWQRISSSVSSSPDWAGGAVASSTRSSRGTPKLWMILDVLTVLGAAILATLYKFQTGPMDGAKGFWQGTLIHGRSMSILLALLCGYTIALLLISRRLHLYTPTRLASYLHEQRMSVQACFTSGLLLTGTLYLVHAEDIPRSVVLITVGLVTISLSIRRLAYRMLIYRRFDRGVGTRNVLIVGTGPEAHALRHHLEETMALISLPRMRSVERRRLWMSIKPASSVPDRVCGNSDTSLLCLIAIARWSRTA
jgi:FlaA1/EpsC-like NDP-sugar epimerase